MQGSYDYSVRETEELKGKVTGLMSHNTKTDPKDLLISSSPENDQKKKCVVQKGGVSERCPWLPVWHKPCLGTCGLHWRHTKCCRVQMSVKGRSEVSSRQA